MGLISLNLESPARIRNFSTSTLADPSADFVHSLIGIPTYAGKPVTRETALRVAAFLSGVKMLANDIAKMPLILRETKITDGRQRTSPALNNTLYTLLKDCPNAWQTSYQMRWFLASQLIMAGNCYCQKITDQTGAIVSLVPLNAWLVTPQLDTSTAVPTLTFRYSTNSGERVLKQDEVWHVSAVNLEGFGLVGSPITALAKECLSVLMAAEETAGRNFLNGLGMGGFISFPQDSGVTEAQAQNIVDRLAKDFSGSQNAGKFSIIPGGGTWQKMSFNAQESQLLESRKWNEQEIVRLLGGAPLLVKLGLGEQNSTYASSTAFLDEYHATSLLPYTTAIEQSITRDLIPRKQWGTLYAKHDPWCLLRGSPKERAEYYTERITNGSMSPNQAAILEDEDTLPGFGDYRFFPANSGYFDPESGMVALPAQMAATPNEHEESEPNDDDPEPEGADTPAPAKPSNSRLTAMAKAAVERIERKAEKTTLDAKFIASVLACSIEDAQTFVDQSESSTPEEKHSMLMSLAMGGE